MDDLYERASRVLDPDVARTYWLRRIAPEPAARQTGRLEVIALASRAEVVNRLTAAAKASVSALLATHGRTINALPDARQVIYQRVRQSSPTPTAKDFTAPTTIETKLVASLWDGHLYRDPAGRAPFALGTWEAATVRAEVARPDFVGWLRNIDRRDWALEVAFTDRDGITRPLYPDILSVRREGETLVVDLLDPHNPTLADGPAKAKGLARFAHRRTVGHLAGSS